MNPLDVVLLLLFIPGIIRGLTKGFLEQAISLIGIFAAIWVSLHFSPWLNGVLAGFFPGTPEKFLRVLSFVLLIVAVFLVVMLLSSILTRVAEAIALGWVNRLLGMVLSLGVSALVIGLLVVVVDALNARFGPINSPWFTESVLFPIFRDGANAIFPLLKEIFGSAAADTAAAAAVATV